MKALAKKSPAAAARPKSASGSGGRSGRRKGAANRLRAGAPVRSPVFVRDRLEQEADGAASAVLKGEINVALRLTRVEAAPPLAYQRSGVALPTAIRTELERGFNADLTAVRLHRGPEAAALTGAMGAVAFAAGRDIYLSGREPRAASEAGRHLLAHEVAHTLQQAGRASVDGRVAVVDTYGTRRPQLSYKSPLVGTPVSSRPSFDQMADLHQPEMKDDRKSLNVLKGIRHDHHAAIRANAEAAFWDKLEKTVTEKDLDAWSTELRSFLCDALKGADRIPAAARLLAHDPFLSTTFFLAELYEQMPDDGMMWVFELWNLNRILSDATSSPKKRDLSPQRFIASIQQFVIGVTRDIPDLSLDTPFETLAADELKKIEAPTGLIENERQLVSLWTVREVDRIRRRKLAEFAAKVTPALASNRGAQNLSPWQRGKIASLLAAWARSPTEVSAQSSTLSAEVVFLLTTIAKPIERTATTLERFWMTVDDYQAMVRSGAVDEVSKKSPRVALQAFAARDEFQKLRLVMLAGANAQFRVGSQAADSSDAEEQGIFPKPAEYERLRDGFVKALRQSVYQQIESKMFSEALKPVAEQGRQPTLRNFNWDLLLAYAWMELAVADLTGVLRLYERSVDDAYVSNAVTRGRADVRVAHRNKLAQWLFFFGSIIGWEEFSDLGRRVHSASVAGQHKSQLALVGAWKDDKAPISLLLEDFTPNAIIQEEEPLTFDNVVVFYRTVQMQNVLNQVTAALAAPDAFADTQKEYLVSRAISASNELGRQAKAYPRRFSVEDYALEMRADNHSDKTYSDLIRSHPKTQALLAAERPIGGESLAPVDPAKRVFLWILPSVLPLIEIMRTGDEFNILIARSDDPSREYRHEDLAAIRALPVKAWFAALNAAYKKARPDDSAAAQQRFRERLKAGFESTRERLDVKFREASILERAADLKNSLIPGLEEYDRWHQFEPAKKLGGVIYEIPGKILTWIGKLTSAMAPVEDQDLHYAAIFLELAGVLYKKLSVSPRIDVSNDYYSAINTALEVVGKKRTGLLALMPGRTGAWIDAQVATLVNLTAELEKGLVTGQMAFGVIGHTGGDRQFVTAVSGGEPIGALKDGKSDPFTVDGIDWSIISVHKNFQFNPRYEKLPSILTVDNKVMTAEQRTPALVLVTVTMNGRKTVITASKSEANEELLNKLSYAVTMALIIRGLNELNAFIEGFAELTLDALELIPAAGQAVMAARFAIAILEFVASGQAQAFADAVSKDPIGEIERVLDVLKSLFSPDELWQFILLGNTRFGDLHSKPSVKKPPAAPESALKRFARLVGRVVNVGEGILGSLARMQSHVRWEVEAAQLSVMRHPILAGGLRWVANHLEQIAQVTLTAVAVGEKLLDKPSPDRAAPEESEGDLKGMFNEAVDALPASVNNAALQLGQFSLPKVILPLGDMVDVIVQIVIGRLGAKYRIVAGVILKLLDIAGKRKAVFDAIGALIPEKQDPNLIWQKAVVNEVTPKLNKAKDELIDTFYDRLLQFDIFKARRVKLEQGRTDAKGETVAPADEELPEPAVQPHGAGSTGPRAAVGTVPNSGRPLAPSLRSGAESRFGHDFKHVRLSSGSAGGYAARFGADAVTSGSHVFLRPGLSPNSGAGAGILDHELVHVLQQTGPRPVGGPHDAAPVPGPRGRGLLIDPISERAADRVSRSVRAGPERGPVSVAKGGKGLQPALPYNVIRGLLDDLTTTKDIETDETRVDRVGNALGRRKLLAKQESRIKNFAQAFSQAVKSTSDFAAPFNDTNIPDAIKSQVLSSVSEGKTNLALIEAALPTLAADSLRERKAKDGEVKGTEPQVVAHIDTGRFSVALARHVFGLTGVLMELRLDPKDSKDEDTPISISKVKITYVHLPFVNANHTLWKLAIKGLQGRNKDQINLLNNPQRLYRSLRLYLESKGTAPGLWKPKTYGLQQRVLDELVVFNEATAAGSGSLEPADLPAKKDYLNPKGPMLGKLGIGLRIGTYDGQAGSDRESHHTTQFLLPEYFNHKNTTQKGNPNLLPFPLIAQAEKIYPGLTATTTAPQQFTGRTRSRLRSL